MEQTPKVHCPKCNSDQIFAGKKGFSAGKAVAGAVLTGGIGVVAGAIGSNKVKLTCLNCGHVFKPGDKPKKEEPKPEPLTPAGNLIVVVITLLLVILLYKACF